MKIRLLTAAVAATLGIAVLPAHAEFMLGEETKGATVKLGEETDLNLRVRLQPRIDFGDVGQNSTTKEYYSEQDMYLRRIRLELTGKLVKNLRYNLTLNADKDDQAFGNSNFGVQYAFLDYQFADAASVLFGQSKLPMSRVSLTSSARQLLIERPVSTEAAKKLFGDYEQTELMLHGKFAGGMVAYMLALADGTNKNQADTTVTNAESDLAYIGRVEFSPPGWIEKGKSDAHLGQGRHLTVALHGGAQNGLKSNGGTTETDRDLRGADFSMHIGGFTAQAEYNRWNVSETGLADKEREGWYAQVGYFFAGANIEPALRYEKYNTDVNAVADKEDTYTTVGVNWYLKGHSMKLGLNWVRTEFGDGNKPAATVDSRDLYQVQAQLYF